MSDPFFLRKVQEAFDWASYIEQHFSFKLSPNGEYRIDCIHCTNAKKKLYVNIDKGYFNCFACDFKTGKFDVFDFVAKHESSSRPAVMMRLCREYQETTPVDIKQALDEHYNSVEPEEERSIKAIEFPLKGMVPVTPDSGKFWDYLRGRGMTDREIAACGVYCAPDDLIIYDEAGKIRGNLKDRVIFPVYGPGNKVVSYQARVIDPDTGYKQKYLACPDSDLRKTFWPFVPPRTHSVALVEGVLDSLALRRLKEDSYACFGKAVSLEQIEQLQKWEVTEVTLLFDIADAKRETVRYAKKLKNTFPVVNVVAFRQWPVERDPGDVLNQPELEDELKSLVNRKVDITSTEYIEWEMTYK